MSKRKTCGNCVHGDFSITYDIHPLGYCAAARILRNMLTDIIGVPISINALAPLNDRLVNVKDSAAHCVAYRPKKES
jgi:hypothetical protein